MALYMYQAAYTVESMAAQINEPVRAKTANRCRIASCTPASGSRTTLPAGS